MIFKKETKFISVQKGMDIREVLESAIKMVEEDICVGFNFNGYTIIVKKGDSVEKIYNEYLSKKI
ncbi:MAG: hypothetical protein PHE67_05330 [Campylobacterales bacterium]|nr:hypothetical protein [Campylobacterales bacterium]